MKKTCVAVLLAAGALQGCGSNQVKMSAEDSAALRQASAIRVVRYRSPAMNITAPKDAPGLGFLGSALVGSGTASGEIPAGHSLASAYGLSDPADEVGRRLAEKLRAEGGLANLRTEPKLLARPLVEEPAHYRSAYKDGLVLEISVENHGASYGAVNWKTYTYFLAGRARLIRMSDGKVLWLDACNIHAFADDAAKRQLDVTEFEKNNAARLKEVLSYTNERCSRVLADKLLGKSS